MLQLGFMSVIVFPRGVRGGFCLNIYLDDILIKFLNRSFIFCFLKSFKIIRRIVTLVWYTPIALIIEYNVYSIINANR